MTPPRLPLSAADALRQRCRRIFNDQRRKARLAGVELSYGVEDLVELARTVRLCVYCRMPVGFDFQFDHKRPVARGGAHALGNLVVACSRCNALKGKLTEDEFAELLALLARLHPAARQDVERRLIAGGVRYARR